ncbi:MAG: DUF1583 domain-containing protein [Planctomycetales bacterium]
MKHFQTTVAETRRRILLLVTTVAAFSVITKPSVGASDTDALHELFGESSLASNVWSVRERAANLPDDEAYQYLSEWVLPGEAHRTPRLTGAFTTTHPAPISDDGRSNGVRLVAPAYDLVDTAARIGRLDELRNRVSSIQSSNDDQKRAMLALQFLVETARRDREAAKTAVDELLTLSANDKRLNYESKWPQLLAAFRGMQAPRMREITSELCTHLSGQVLAWRSSGNVAWDNQVAALYGLQRSFKTNKSPADTATSTENSLWIPGSVYTAKSRGTGMPTSRWHRGRAFVDKLSPHNIDFLYYRIPLTGDFDVECEATTGGVHNTGLMFGGFLYALRNRETFDLGNIRATKQTKLETPLTHVDRWGRLRIRVRDRSCTTWFNGKQISVRQLPERHDPWLAIYSFGRHQSSVRNLRINGEPAVLAEVEMATEDQLVGWVPYFQERVGTANDTAQWRFVEDPAGPGIFGVRSGTPSGANQESLLQYHRPINRHAEIEYEFYYEPGKTLVHPTLDRLTFLLEPDGVQIHWVTDGRFDQGGTDPGNRSTAPRPQRGVAEIPLLPAAWNRLKLRVRGETVDVILNDELICERPLEADNQRTFGLFHFADRTDVRVRNIVMRGDWPQSLPHVSNQELADTKKFPEQHFAKLPAVFTHDFAADGFSSQYFNLAPSNGKPVESRRNGLFATTTGAGTWTSLNQYARFVVHGDFDIEVAFEELKTHGDKSAGVMLMTQLADQERYQYRVMRSKDSRNREQIIMSESALKPGGSRSYDSHVGTICEGSGGRLRIARKGEVLYYLFADNDSSTFHVLESLKASTADTTSDGIVFRVMCNGTASASVIWKQLTIRSNKLTWYPPPDAERPWKLFVMNEDGSELRAVADRRKGYRSLGSPEWSADGKQIAFDTYQASLNDSRSNVVNIDDGELVDCGPGCMPSQSPDGKRIVFTQSGRGILMMDADGSNREEIDRSGWSAQWSPDGKHLAWGQGGNIVVMNLKTRKRTPILVGAQATMFGYTYWNPGWSHDSRSIAFKARNRRTGGEDIVVADIDSPDGFQILVAATKGVHPDFTFSPDNRRVMFSMNDPDDGVPRLYTVDRMNPGQPQQLAGQPRDWKIFSCDWHPSGKIAFSGEKIIQPLDWATAVNSMKNVK